MSAATEVQLLTAEEFLAQYEELPAELIRGEVVHMTPPGEGHSRSGMRAAGFLFMWSEATGRGIVYDEIGVILSRGPDTVRAPDAAYYGPERVPPPRERGYVETVPDLVVEIASRDDPQQDVLGKAGMWLDHGVREVWVVWPWLKAVTVLRGPGDQVTLHVGDTLASPEILPGFELPLERLFR